MIDYYDREKAMKTRKRYGWAKKTSIEVIIEKNEVVARGHS